MFFFFCEIFGFGELVFQEEEGTGYKTGGRCTQADCSSCRRGDVTGECTVDKNTKHTSPVL